MPHPAADCQTDVKLDLEKMLPRPLLARLVFVAGLLGETPEDIAHDAIVLYLDSFTPAAGNGVRASADEIAS